VKTKKLKSPFQRDREFSRASSKKWKREIKKPMHNNPEDIIFSILFFNQFFES